LFVKTAKKLNKHVEKKQETGMYTRRTLTKVMENIPLYLDLTTCRQGLGDRQTSIEWAEPDQVRT
jgi:hypothetical protein